MDNMMVLAQMLESMSGPAKEAFIWWLVTTYGFSFVAIMTGIGAAFGLIRMWLKHLIRKDHDSAVAGRLALALRVSSYWYADDVTVAEKILSEYRRKTDAS